MTTNYFYATSMETANDLLTELYFKFSPLVKYGPIKEKAKKRLKVQQKDFDSKYDSEGILKHSEDYNVKDIELGRIQPIYRVKGVFKSFSKEARDILSKHIKERPKHYWDVFTKEESTEYNSYEDNYRSLQDLGLLHDYTPGMPSLKEFVKYHREFIVEIEANKIKLSQDQDGD
jgi:hypothetical protein